jgi:hypothetical protein
VFFGHPPVTRNISANIYVTFSLSYPNTEHMPSSPSCFLLSGQWMALTLNLPLVAYNVRKCVNPYPIHTLISFPPSPRSLRPILLTLPPFTESCPKATSTTQRKSSERFHNTRRRALSSLASTSSPSSTIYTGTFALSSDPLLVRSSPSHTLRPFPAFVPVT